MRPRALGKRRKTVETIVKTPRTISTTRRPHRSSPPPDILTEPLQQVDRTYVLYRGRRLSYFGGCDYFRLSSHPEVLRALREGLDRFGLNVAASRKTTGNHALYGQLERTLAEFFGVEAAVLVSNGYMTNLAVAQALAGEFTHALIDERSHGSLFDAAKLLDCLVLPFKHRDTGSAAKAVRQTGRKAKILLLTDGLFSHSGELAPLEDYLRLLPASAMLLIDDAHGAGTLGKTGRGTTELLSVAGRRLIRTITLSKAFGVYGGAVISSLVVRKRIVAGSRLFVGNTPLPLPLAAAAFASLEILRTDLHLRRRLVFNTSYVKAALRDAGLSVNDGPGPIIPFVPRNGREADQLTKKLLAEGIHPPLINYLGGPEGGYFRFAISSEHTPEQLEALVRALVSR